jgi:CHAT domain-containing protein
LGYGSWANLPGTKIEVEKLKKMISSCDIYEGEAVNEKKIKELSLSQELMNYRIIHFATHGMVVPEVPELSALVLSQNQNGGDEDNYLRADEISKLKMQADFIALSACETGLGKIYKGDGVVGLTQSFMIAGANSLAVSLWQVADESTSIFMTGIYSLTGIDNNYLRALNQMKRNFISGAYGEKYKAPYFWAPFVYYGKFHGN